MNIVNKIGSFSGRRLHDENKIKRKLRIKEKRLYKRVLIQQDKLFSKNYKFKTRLEKLPTVEINFSNKLSVQGLVDTGSSINLLNQNMLNDLIRLKLVKMLGTKELPCYTANNQHIKILGSCIVKVKINRFSWNVKFLIAKDIEHKVILGSPFIKESQMLIDLSKNHCYFEFCKTVKVNLGQKGVRNVNSIESNSSKLNIGCNEAKYDIEKLVKKYPNVFTNKIGKALNFEYEIVLKDKQVVRLPAYPLNGYKQLKLKELTDKLLREDIIEHSLSEYCSPSFLVKKPNSEDFRLVINYGQLNCKIETVDYPLGNLHSCYEYLYGARWFSVLDLTNSFHQIPLSENCRKYTAFSAGNFQKFQWKRVPYGMNLGSGLLSGYLDKIFSQEKLHYLLSYVDDLLIYSKTLEEHKIHLNNVFKKLSDNNLTVNPDKMKLCFNEVSFLGNIVSYNEIKVDPSRTKAILQCKQPRNKKELASFIGMVSYLSKYLKDYSVIAAPLNELRKKNCKFKFTQQCMNAFQKLKEMICSPPVLAIPNLNAEFELYTDASEIGCGGALMQKDEFGVSKPVSYFSKKFTESERNLSVYQKEALGVILSFNKFNCYLEHREFKLYTDNSALSYVLSHFKKINKLGRWCEQILKYKFTVYHVKGKDNKLADFLSRNFVPEECNIKVKEVEEVNNVNNRFKFKAQSKLNRCTNMKFKSQVNVISQFPLAFTKLSELQRLDEECLKIIQSVNNKTCKENFYIKSNVLMFKRNERCTKGKIYLPESLINMIFAYYHVENYYGGHPGYSRTLSKINDKFYRPNLANLIKERVKTCEICKMSKPTQRRFEGELMSKHCEVPLGKLYIDTAGPLTTSINGNKHILIVLDDCTRFVWLVPLRNVTSKSVIKALQTHVFNNFSSCEQLISDNGSCFKSIEFKNFMFKHGINHHRIVSYKPSGNVSERYLRTVKTQMRCYFHNKQRLWDTEINYVQTCLNTCLNESLGNSSHNLMFKHPANHALSNLWRLNELVNEDYNNEQCIEIMSKAVQNVKRSINHNKNRLRYSQDRIKHPFVIGSRVYKENHFLSSKKDNYQAKMDLKFSGPFEIIYFLNNVTVLIQDIKDRSHVKRANISQLKLA